MNARAFVFPFRLLGEELFSIPAFPLWWYGAGFVGLLKYFGKTLHYRTASYALRIWTKNLFVPMYGQYDRTGRLVSIFMRLVVIFFRSLALGFEVIADVVLALLWLTAPVIAIGLLVTPFLLRV